MAQQSSRLHRLLTLLDTGSTQATRITAAQQIGDIAKAHPQDLSTLLKKVSQYLHSKSWETRVAAARAIGAIAESSKHTSIDELFLQLESELLHANVSDEEKDQIIKWCKADPASTNGLSFKSFDIGKVLDFGNPLLASGGQEYDVSSDNNKSSADRLARQKQNLRRRLGLDVCEEFMDVHDMIQDEDLMVRIPYQNGASSVCYSSQTGQHIQQLVASMVPSSFPKRVSARELNLLKRKAKVNVKEHPKGWSEDDDSDQQLNSPAPRLRHTNQINSDKLLLDAEVDQPDQQEPGSWPFQHFVEQLTHDIFDPLWEVRHGSAMALREIYAHQAASAAVVTPDMSSQISSVAEADGKSEFSLGIKRERDVDLNNPDLTIATEPPQKIQKSGSDVGLERNLYSLVEKEPSAQLELADVAVSSKRVFENGGSTINSMKVEHDSSFITSDILHEEPIFIDHYPAFIQHILSNPSEFSRLGNLLRLARHSWVKNWEFLQDSAIRFLCVLALDRFGDYVSDQVVAPVRETCAQSLGVVLKHMHNSLVNETLSILLQMQNWQDWEVRHGGLLGIKYLVAVRQEMLHELLGCVLPSCKSGLEDPDDDVRAVAAEALIPAAPSIVSLMGETLPSIIMLLWDILLDLDDLSPSTSSVMNLLAEIYSQPEVAPRMLERLASRDNRFLDLNEVFQADVNGGAKTADNPYVLSSLAPRLWPFMRHNITAVRHAAICTLERLLEAGSRSCSESALSSFWPSSILGETLRMVFQNLLLEREDEILQCSQRVWKLLLQCSSEDLEAAATSFCPSWLELITTPYGSALDATKMFWPTVLPRKSHFRAAAKMMVLKEANNCQGGGGFEWGQAASLQDQNAQPAGSAVRIIVGADSEKSVTRTRVITSEALGILISKLPVSSLPSMVDLLHTHLAISSGVQRQVSSMILAAWFKELKIRESLNTVLPVLVNPLQQLLLDLLSCPDPAFPTKSSRDPYFELTKSYSKLRSEANLLYKAADSSSNYEHDLSSISTPLDVLGVDDAIAFASGVKILSSSAQNGTSESHVIDEVEILKQRLISTSGYLKCVQANLHITVTSMVAGAVVWMSDLPSKLNPIILPLMAAVKREQEEILQEKAAEALAELIFCCIARKLSPNDKLIKNLCTLTCADPSETPQASLITSMEMLENQELMSFKRSPSISKPKAPSLSSGEERSRVEGFICRRGSEIALRCLCNKFGPSLFDKLPRLWDCLTEVLKPTTAHDAHPQKPLPMESQEPLGEPQALINNLQVICTIAPLLDNTLKEKLQALLPCIFGCLYNQHVAVKLAASKCITLMAMSMKNSVMQVVMKRAIPMLGDSSSVHARQGAGMLLNFLVQGLGVELVPYAPFLVVPLLGCMSDSDHAVRQSVTRSFAALVPLLPLARGVPSPTELGSESKRNTEDVLFLEQLLDNSHIDDYKLHTKLKVTLRRYQQEGINWLSFLRRFKLHGILCDDMGLGKTLQASAIVASDIEENRASSNDNDLPPSLVICPSTLVAHWAFEIEKYIDPSVIIPLQYVGSVPERTLLRNDFGSYNVIITSYDVVRKDIDHLQLRQWNYCILDEGHIIKNSKAKVTLAVKQLKATHRLILTGTPIQNNVLELWSLFDFLMPGFLGTERQFQAAYGKPLSAAKDSKRSAKDAEAGCLAMEALHKQVMPFLLRRTKDEVLSDLPEKIIQDRYCDLSPLQLKLYERFSKSDVRKEISTLVEANELPASNEETIPSSRTSRHVFQAIQYLLKLCSHPLLVLGDKPPSFVSSILSEITNGAPDVTNLHDLKHSPKLVALQQILEECGIGMDMLASEASVAGNGQHRALIFAQHKSLLDIIERDLFQSHMKSLTYLRLDGSVETDKRFEIVKMFNSDPTIDVLLLTTHVGGLGLNLTSADTLIFMEHDWNPMRDLQAMDRAHRLGQRKVVNVQRLIMRGTLEEKVMSLQKFKLSVANAVVNADNASLKTMNTNQLLDLFTPAESTRKGGSQRGPTDNQDSDSKTAVGGKGLKAILNGLEELWDQSQYTEEYNMTQFLAKLDS